jgi:hypothetical protein
MIGATYVFNRPPIIPEAFGYLICALAALSLLYWIPRAPKLSDYCLVMVVALDTLGWFIFRASPAVYTRMSVIQFLIALLYFCDRGLDLRTEILEPRSPLFWMFLVVPSLGLLVGLVDANRAQWIISDTFNFVFTVLVALMLLEFARCIGAIRTISLVAAAHGMAALPLLAMRMATATWLEGPNLLAFVWSAVSLAESSARKPRFFPDWLSTAYLFTLPLVAWASASRRCTAALIFLTACALVIYGLRSVPKFLIRKETAFAVIVVGLFALGFTNEIERDVGDTIRKWQSTTQEGRVVDPSAVERIIQVRLTVGKMVEKDSMQHRIIGYGSGASFFSLLALGGQPGEVGESGSTNFRLHTIHNTAVAIAYRYGGFGFVIFAICLWYIIARTRITLIRLLDKRGERLVLCYVLTYLFWWNAVAYYLNDHVTWALMLVLCHTDVAEVD